jgi:hypothetical protein
MADDADRADPEWTRPTPDDAPGESSARGEPSARAGTDADAGSGTGARDRPGEESLPESVARRMQARLGISADRWFVVESVLLFLPYPLFVLVYVAFPVPEVPFLALTVAYSLFAVWFGFRGANPRQS